MNENYPSILDRIKSTLIDSIIVIVCMMFFSDLLNSFENVPNWVRITLFFSLLMYEPVCTAYGATFGNHKMGIRVRKQSNENERISIFQAIIRYFLKIILGWFSFISVFLNPKSRTIHDIISGSVMIKIDEKQS
ncbi:RDD family protein [Flavobacterium aquatile]|uniref:RDD domain-containing protein n=1 Tax=Flavobacterium aquatile LMG 4008 = ATCC 11947 TaxID=1453498 RepID=A0A095UZ28_9FLAO|nr:RDD family protein [Flavobacterium aquatile]KGD67835.1 hypothetical protein LG45_12015 [Flavobacterium aquatile LMG 4008 = ATCC 11947]OXA67697.1 RDD family protein [Flavobacterium aquatile] [Flavobacterium aquatile LMG 4008 = ATCC 11947]GEC78334.1 hypothetical protein FAQ01_12040 [Flavobacterium aquatile]